MRQGKRIYKEEEDKKQFPLRLGVMILLVSFVCGCGLKSGKTNSDPNSSKHQNGQLVTIPGDNKIAADDKTEAEASELAILQKQIEQNSCGAGVALLGYIDSELSMTDLSIYLEANAFIETYPFLSDAAYFMTEGQELYAIVPPNEKGKVTVYPSDITENGEYADDKSHPLFEGKPGEVLVLRCNFSEIYSNVLVSVTDGGGAIEFHPSISLMDGHLAELAGVYDFSVYEETPDERSVEIATEILLEYGEVRQGLENGMKLMYTGESEIINGGSCMLFVLGTDNGEQFVQEQLYGVCDNLIYIYDVFTDTWNAAY